MYAVWQCVEFIHKVVWCALIKGGPNKLNWLCKSSKEVSSIPQATFEENPEKEAEPTRNTFKVHASTVGSNTVGRVAECIGRPLLIALGFEFEPRSVYKCGFFVLIPSGSLELFQRVQI